MADYNGVNYAKSILTPPTILEVGENGGRVRFMYDLYEAIGNAIASRILMGPKLPKGARILPQSCLMTDDLGTTTTLAVGDGTTADRFLAATTCVTAKQQTFFTQQDELGKALTAETQLYLTVGADTATGTIEVFILYTLD